MDLEIFVGEACNDAGSAESADVPVTVFCFRCFAYDEICLLQGRTVHSRPVVFERDLEILACPDVSAVAVVVLVLRFVEVDPDGRRFGVHRVLKQFPPESDAPV